MAAQQPKFSHLPAAVAPCAALGASSNPLGSLRGLARLTALAELDINRCALAGGAWPGALAELRSLSLLRALDVGENDCGSLEGLPLQGLTRLQAWRCGLLSLQPLAGCSNLVQLEVTSNHGLTSLGGLQGCGGLTVSGGARDCGAAGAPCKGKLGVERDWLSWGLWRGLVVVPAEVGRVLGVEVSKPSDQRG
jgi:hypothetical protein